MKVNCGKHRLVCTAGSDSDARECFSIMVFFGCNYRYARRDFSFLSIGIMADFVPP